MATWNTWHKERAWRGVMVQPLWLMPTALECPILPGGPASPCGPGKPADEDKFNIKKTTMVVSFLQVVIGWLRCPEVPFSPCSPWRPRGPAGPGAPLPWNDQMSVKAWPTWLRPDYSTLPIVTALKALRLDHLGLLQATYPYRSIHKGRRWSEDIQKTLLTWFLDCCFFNSLLVFAPAPAATLPAALSHRPASLIFRTNIS